MKTEQGCCQYAVSVPCGNKAVIELDGEHLCRQCAAIEKGRLELSKKVLQRAMSKVDQRLKVLKGIKAVQNDSPYRVILRADGEEDVV